MTFTKRDATAYRRQLIGDGCCRGRRQLSEQRNLLRPPDALLHDDRRSQRRTKSLLLLGVLIGDLRSDIIRDHELGGMTGKKIHPVDTEEVQQYRGIGYDDGRRPLSTTRISPHVPPGPGEAKCRRGTSEPCSVPGSDREISPRGDMPRWRDARFRCGVHGPGSLRAPVHQHR